MSKFPRSNRHASKNTKPNDLNQKTYTSQNIVQHYVELSALQPAEVTVLKLLQPLLGSMKMLDIGVGGGRTTQHFSGITAEYMGIDYSAEMIAACQKRFPNTSAVLQVCDVRDMSQFEDDSFDFILFSFNGIDYMSHADRLKAFAEIQRVGKPGGYFCFSSHNLNGFERQFDFRQQFSLNPLKTYVNLVMAAFLHLFNLPMTLKELRRSPYAILKDESHNFRLNTYYIRPQEQLEQLKLHFENTRIYSWQTGLEITPPDKHYRSDGWLYYLCNIKSSS
jgi:ubiquinone/menaquinone biosynthesis C-methylase UbiE